MRRALALLCLLLVAASSPPQQQRGQPQRQSEQAIANALERIAAAAERDNEAAAYTADCQQGRDNRRSDLCAQWKAADAASEAAGWAGWTWWLGLGGVAIGLGTLGAACAAAYFAKEAADHTKTGADEAKRAADAAEADQRPWIQVSVRPQFTYSGSYNMTISLLLTLKNIGRLPAQNIRYEAEAIQTGLSPGDHPFFDNPCTGNRPDRPVRALPPQGEFTDQELVWIPWAQFEKDNIPLIGVNVAYRLPGGGEAQTSVSYLVGTRVEDEFFDLGPLVPADGSKGDQLGAKPHWHERYT